MVDLKELESYCNNLLEVERFKDYCPNGLQVEGRPDVNRLVCGVTASQALLDAALDAGADAILVHHGYFWSGEDPRIVGMKQRRIKSLLSHEVSLLAYHLPLDAHPIYGNNAQLAKRLGLSIEGHFGPDRPEIGLYGRLARPTPAKEFAALLARQLDRSPLHIAAGRDTIHSLAWCSGAAQGYIEQAAALGVDAYLTGEASEQTVHVAREYGLHFFAAGHHATERDGARALGEHLALEFGLEQQFIDIPNPV
ncbi:MAG: Nif3-like dinuclear metal center hexameric protein [Proteobacteria bacterium]|jgi:dinuclear metal center YbgI/SA1388 family protein|nr:Nif3-like dinuclear metal center hexameric protein [Pseudomonadota bacterium]MCG6934374.1 Nif3-like dinuclear metal center hexameric protein [Pseudomonadota bacterium]